eukprot:1889116-Pyramimonas_sp.AAC.1
MVLIGTTVNLLRHTDMEFIAWDRVPGLVLPAPMDMGIFSHLLDAFVGTAPSYYSWYAPSPGSSHFKCGANTNTNQPPPSC